MFEPTSEYSDVTEMFRLLKLLDDGSLAFRRQRDAIVQRSLPLADHIARRSGGRGEPFDDLVQAARVGLVSAVNRFDVDNGADFLSFAVPTMMGEVRRHFRDHGWAIKVPRRVKELQPQLIRGRAELSQRLGRAPNASEIADHLGIDRAVVVDATIGGGNYSTMSTDMPIGDGDDYRPVGDTLGDVDPNLDKVLDVETVRPLIAALPEGTELSSPFDSSRTSPKLKSPNVSAARRCTFRAYLPRHSTLCAAMWVNRSSPSPDKVTRSGAGVSVRLSNRLRFEGTPLPQKDRQPDYRCDSDEFALPVLHRLEPELRRRHIALHRDRHLPMLHLLLVERVHTAHGVQRPRGEEQHEKRDRQ